MKARNHILTLSLIFWISGFCFALPSQGILTVIRFSEYSSVPFTNAYDATDLEPVVTPTSNTSSITEYSPKQDQQLLECSASTSTTAPHSPHLEKTQPTDFQILTLLISLTPLVVLPRKTHLRFPSPTHSIVRVSCGTSPSERSKNELNLLYANGNISEYIDLADGSIDAHLEYDAFGRTIASTGNAPSSFGFSTKYLDGESSYYYYGFRYYDPETGRWPNRDPIEEQGGYNLYGFVGNDGVGKWDLLGLEEVELTDIGDGVGPIITRLYMTTGSCCELTCKDVIAEFRRDINQFTTGSLNPLANTPFSDGNGGNIDAGDVLDIDGPLLVNPQVQVIFANDSMVKFQTVKGHPESGRIIFRCDDLEPADGDIGTSFVFSINSLTQNSSLFSLASYTSGDPMLDTIARAPLDSAYDGIVRGYGYIIQTAIWNNVLSKVINKAGCGESENFLSDMWWDDIDDVPDIHAFR